MGQHTFLSLQLHCVSRSSGFRDPIWSVLRDNRDESERRLASPPTCAVLCTHTDTHRCRICDILGAAKARSMTVIGASYSHCRNRAVNVITTHHWCTGAQRACALQGWCMCTTVCARVPTTHTHTYIPLQAQAKTCAGSFWPCILSQQLQARPHICAFCVGEQLKAPH